MRIFLAIKYLAIFLPLNIALYRVNLSLSTGSCQIDSEGIHIRRDIYSTLRFYFETNDGIS